MIKILWILFFLVNVTLVKANDNSASLEQVISGKQRSSEHKARDKYRHPQQTLEFLLKSSINSLEYLIRLT